MWAVTIEHMFVESMEATRPVLEGLNEEQQAAVTHAGGPLLVLAGAGTGKTTTLVSRHVWLVNEGVPAERIMLLTFTRRAAREMLSRARALLGEKWAGGVTGGTFHSVAYHLIAGHSSALGLPPRFGVLDAGDAADLLNLIREELGFASARSRFPQKETLLSIYSRCVNAQQQLSEVLAAHYPWCEEHLESLSDLFRGYEQRKRQLGRLDLDDLLVYLHALARHEVVGRKLGRMFEHVLADEYQDLNRLQVEIVRDLRREQRGLTAVGDDAQAIYSFRAASAEHILRFSEDFPDATVVTLEQNYRSTQPILDLANEVWADAVWSYPKRLRAVQEGGLKPQLVSCLDQGSQASEVCDQVLTAREEGILLREQAVLMRAGRHSNELELELGRRGIPFRKFGGISYLEAAHVKDLVCALRIADDPSDQLSWFRVLQLPPGVGTVTARRALDALGLDTLTDIAELPQRWTQAVEPLLKPASQTACTPLIDALVRCPSNPRVDIVAEQIRHALEPLIKAHYPDWNARLPDLNVLVDAAQHASTLSGFLAEVALDPPSSSADYAAEPTLDDDYLTLSTVHSAKGLEWDAVHVINASDGNFPSDMALSNPEGLEEERRLFYVALTRARRHLNIYIPVRHYHHPNGGDDDHGYGKQSRFLTDAAQALCETTDLLNHPQQPKPGNADRRDLTVEVNLSALWQ